MKKGKEENRLLEKQTQMSGQWKLKNACLDDDIPTAANVYVWKTIQPDPILGKTQLAEIEFQENCTNVLTDSDRPKRVNRMTNTNQ